MSDCKHKWCKRTNSFVMYCLYRCGAEKNEVNHMVYPKGWTNNSHVKAKIEYDYDAQEIKDTEDMING